MTDIRTTIGDTRFDVRACGLLLDGERFVVSTEEDGTRTLPGGAVKIGETTEAAVIREFYEETNLQVQPRCLLAIIENHFELKQQRHQQIIFVYELTKSKEDQILQKEAVLAQWQPLTEIVHLKPTGLKQLLGSSETPLHIINKEGTIA